MNICRFRRASRFIASTVTALACLSSASVSAAVGDAGLRVVSGEVTRLRGQWMTKSRPAVLGLPGGGQITLHSDTDASLLTDPQSLMLLPGRKTPTYTLILRRGLVDVDLAGEKEGRLAVAVGTPTDVRLITLSGQSTIKAAGHSVIAVSQVGLTTVSQGPKLVRLPNGIKREYQGHGGQVDHALLAPTAWIGGRRIWVAASDSAARVAGYVWAPVANAHGYIVSMRDLASKRIVTKEQVTSPVLESVHEALSPGAYELDIAAIDADGFVSKNSRRMPIRVVGLELPGGATVLPRDTVTIAAEQKIRLTHADGLTLTTAAHKTGVPGSEPFGLEGLDRAAILIHPPGGGDLATLTLVRREQTVSTWVGPKLATWPDDPIQLQVSFVDDRGVPTPNDVEPTIRVLVGVEPVDVTWDKHGSLWQAQLPSMPGGGPWVVRLEVVDQYGVIIGRDFAEVVKTRTHPRFPELRPEALPPLESAAIHVSTR